MNPTHKWMPVVDLEKCSGCGLCADACGPACLEMSEALAVLTVPDACGSEEHCIGVCADDAIEMAWVPYVGDISRGKWRALPDRTANLHPSARVISPLHGTFSK